jgi:SAM-dependent methyltransferase
MNLLSMSRKSIGGVLRSSWEKVIKGFCKPILIKYLGRRPEVTKINLCGGDIHIPGYLSVDLVLSSDLILDLSKRNLPFKSNSIDIVVCISAINYFTRERGRQIIKETYRVLHNGGIARFAVQDLRSLAQRYVDNDLIFYFQKLADNTERFTGPTIGDKFASWLYGYATAGGPCRYFYDFDSLAYLFREAGFTTVENKNYLDSRISEINKIDNRPDQMFFLEAVK